MFSQANALSPGSQLWVVVLVSALQALWQHPVIRCILSNNLLGASGVFPDNAMESHSYVTLLCCGKHQRRREAAARLMPSTDPTSVPCPTHACQPLCKPLPQLLFCPLLLTQVVLDAYTLS